VRTRPAADPAETIGQTAHENGARKRRTKTAHEKTTRDRLAERETLEFWVAVFVVSECLKIKVDGFGQSLAPNVRASRFDSCHSATAHEATNIQIPGIGQLARAVTCDVNSQN
jgi:hypothetical protein